MDPFYKVHGPVSGAVHNPFLTSIYLIDLIQELNRPRFLYVLALAGMISASVMARKLLTMALQSPSSHPLCF